jgi:hypothetical protein
VSISEDLVFLLEFGTTAFIGNAIATGRPTGLKLRLD